jgi:hypothetical protein
MSLSLSSTIKEITPKCSPIITKIAKITIITKITKIPIITKIGPYCIRKHLHLKYFNALQKICQKGIFNPQKVSSLTPLGEG